jgi:hypothetical protein
MTAPRMVARLTGPRAGAAGGRIITETHVADVLVRLDGLVLANQAAQGLRQRWLPRSPYTWYSDSMLYVTLNFSVRCRRS